MVLSNEQRVDRSLKDTFPFLHNEGNFLVFTLVRRTLRGVERKVKYPLEPLEGCTFLTVVRDFTDM